MEFACELMDLCRGTQEVEAVLSEGTEENGNNRDPLARLKMAMEYEEKKVENTRNMLKKLDKRFFLSVCSSSKLSATSNKYMAWTRDGIPTITRLLEENTHVAFLSSTRALRLPHLHSVSRFQGQ